MKLIDRGAVFLEGQELFRGMLKREEWRTTDMFTERLLLIALWKHLQSGVELRTDRNRPESV